MTRTSEEALRETQAHFALMLEHATGDLTDQLVIDAVCMRLSAGIESLSGLDEATRDRLFGEAWPLMWGMRNRIAHGYLLVDAGIVRRTLAHDIPPILARRFTDDRAFRYSVAFLWLRLAEPACQLLTRRFVGEDPRQSGRAWATFVTGWLMSASRTAISGSSGPTSPRRWKRPRLRWTG